MLNDIWEEFPIWVKISLAILVIVATITLGAISLKWVERCANNHKWEEMGKEVNEDDGIHVHFPKTSPEK